MEIFEHHVLNLQRAWIVVAQSEVGLAVALVQLDGVIHLLLLGQASYLLATEHVRFRR